jgi:hydrogenase expression/formation protein HypD
MKYLDEYRDARLARAYADKIKQSMKKPWTIMEICGGQTHSILKYGIEDLVPPELTIVHGPGCPVCVTPVEMIDKAIAIALLPDVIFTSFGDMLRVPGSSNDLLNAKAMGGDVRMVYSPLDAVKLAEKHPAKRVVFFGIGFETTAPANAMAIVNAKKLGLKNFSMLSAHVLVPPAIEAILSSPVSQIEGFLAAGHVCTVMGFEEYLPLAQKYEVSIVVTGFEPVDILEGILMTVNQLEMNKFEVGNQYRRVVKRKGNLVAQNVIREVFTTVDRKWRGIGNIPKSGLGIKESYAEFDAELIFDVKGISAKESDDCIAGEVLQGLKKPPQCKIFGIECTPEHPKGAPMVSSEGACAAYFRYGKSLKQLD